MNRAFLVSAAITAALIMATPSLAGHLALPHIHVTANNLGGGLINYQVEIFNPIGGPIAVEVTAHGAFNQIDANVPVFAGGTGMLDPVDTNSVADAAEALDASYLAAGGKAADSWWDNTDLSSAGPPFGGAMGGEVGSTVFSSSTNSPAGGDIATTRLAQFVIFDLAAAALPLGPQPVVAVGLAPFSFVNDSVLATQGPNVLIDGTFGVVPEPSSLILFSTGLLGLACLGLRHTLWKRGA